MAKKNKNIEPEIIEEDTQDIELYEIDERYGITPDGIVYDLEKETALVPVLDDIGRPCVKINRKRIPIDELKRKYLPDPIRDERANESVTHDSERSEDRVGRMSGKNEHNNYNSETKSKSKNKNIFANFKLEGKTYADIFEASKDLGITANVIRAYLITRK